jgi:hypothetical protein
MNTSRVFARTIGIDYSGAETPTASLKGLCVYLAEGDAPPVEVSPPQSSRKYWSRKGIAQWLVERLAEAPTLRSATVWAMILAHRRVGLGSKVRRYVKSVS